MMLAAMAIFVQQGTMIAASQAAASAGFMPQPATVLSGAVHFHDNLAVNVHVHGGHLGAGHVHGPADVDHDDESDDTVNAPICSIGQTCAVLSADAYTVPSPIVHALECPLPGLLDGIEPDGLNRPPSTPGIA